MQAQGYGEKSYHAIRAASLLATGRQQEADQEVARAVQENREDKTWADNLPALERAIQAGDRNFVYEPSECLPDDPVFLDEVQ